MSLKDDIQAAIAKFESDNAGKVKKGAAYVTSGDRTWAQQLDIILQPKRKNNYLNIKARFLKFFKLAQLPVSSAKLTEEQRKWWQTEIMKQAGKPRGFAHVGGKAVDVSVKNLDTAQKTLLQQALNDAGFSVLLEKVTESSSAYGVTLEQANVFHCEEDPSLRKTPAAPKAAGVQLPTAAPSPKARDPYSFITVLKADGLERPRTRQDRGKLERIEAHFRRQGWPQDAIDDGIDRLLALTRS